MDWLKDKKNQPIVAGIAIAVIVIVGFSMYWFMFRPSGSADQPVDTGATSDPSMATGDPGAMGGMPGTPGAPASPSADSAPSTPAPATPAAAQTADVSPMEAWRTDPFLPQGYKPPKKDDRKLKPPIRDFPFYKFPTPKKDGGGAVRPVEHPQPVRRMAGILLNERVYAIIEANGKSQIVQPGDMLEDRLATVEKIEADKVILKTTDDKPRYLVVRMASAPRTQDANTYDSGAGASAPGRPMPMPGMGPMPMMPGARDRRPSM